MKKNYNKCEECYKDGKKPSDIDCAKCDEVIIDGVNVAECEFLDDISLQCVLNKYFIAIINPKKCSNNPDCYFKQLQRAKAENEKLKKEIDNLRRVD